MYLVMIPRAQLATHLIWRTNYLDNNFCKIKITIKIT